MTRRPAIRLAAATLAATLPFHADAAPRKRQAPQPHRQEAPQPRPAQPGGEAEFKRLEALCITDKTDTRGARERVEGCTAWLSSFSPGPGKTYTLSKHGVASAYWNRARAHFFLGHFDLCIADAGTSLRSVEVAGAYAVRARCVAKKGDVRAGLQDIQKALGMDGADWIRLSRAQINADARNYADALVDYTILAEKHPGDIQTRGWQAEALDNVGRHAEALGIYKSLSLAQPQNNDWLHHIYSINRHDLGDDAAALAALGQMIANNPGALRNRVYRAEIYASSKNPAIRDLNTAVYEMAKAIGEDEEASKQEYWYPSTSFEDYRNITQWLLELGETEKAAIYADKSMARDKDKKWEGRMLRARVLSRQGKKAEAREEGAKVVAEMDAVLLEKKDYWSQLKRNMVVSEVVDLYIEQGDRAGGVDFQLEHLPAKMGVEEILRVSGKIIGSGDTPEAKAERVRLIEKTIPRLPDGEGYGELKGALQVAHGWALFPSDPQAAGAAFDGALKYGKNYNAFQGKAFVARLKGDARAEQQAYGDAYRADPSVDAQKGMVEAMIRGGMLDDARKEIGRLEKNAIIYAHIDLSLLEEKQGNLVGALDAAEKAVAGNAKNVEGHARRAAVLLRMGRTAMAESSALKGLEVSAANGWAPAALQYDVLARAQQALGKADEAGLNYQRAAQVDVFTRLGYQLSLKAEGLYAGPADGLPNAELGKALDECAKKPGCNPSAVER